MRFALRLLPPILFVAALVVACGDDEVSPFSSSSSGASGGGASGSSGVLLPRDGGQAAPGMVGSIAIDDIVEITVGSDTCNKPANQCFDAQSFTVDFGTGTLTHTTCVELGGPPDGGGGGTQDATTTKPLTPEQLDDVKARLAALTTGPRGAVDGGSSNPSQTLLVVTKAQGEVSFATETTLCVTNPRTQGIRTGWQELYDTLRAF